MGTRNLPQGSSGHPRSAAAVIAWLLWLAVATVLALTVPDELVLGGAGGVLWVVGAVTWGWLGLVVALGTAVAWFRRLLWRQRSKLQIPVPPATRR